MEITMESVHRMVREYGAVSIVDSAGKVQPLKAGNPDVWALVEKADTFLFAGSRYDREQFEKVLDRMLSKPGTATQINCPNP